MFISGDWLLHMNFRPAIAEDIAHLLPMLVDHYALHTAWDGARYAVQPGFEVGYGRWMTARTTDPSSVFLVATPEDSDTPIGFLLATTERELPLYTLKTYGFVQDVYVAPAYRNEGIARQLVALAVEAFKEQGVTQIRADVAHPNVPAQNLFARASFRSSSTTYLLEL